MRTELFLSALLSVGLFACAGDKDGTDTDVTDTDGGGDTDDTDTTAAVDSFDIEGSVTDIGSNSAAAAGLCVRLLDPTPVVAGGEALKLATGTLDASGAYSFTGVTAKPQLGLLVEVADCAAPATVYTSSTGISNASYADLADGAVLSGVRTFSIDLVLLGGMQGSAAVLGYGGDLATEGFLFAFVLDAAGNPVADATVSCASCGTTYYMDADPVDGLFSTGLAPNAGTVVTSNAAFLIPAAPISSYVTTAPGLTYGNVTIGSNPGGATIAAFYAD